MGIQRLDAGVTPGIRKHDVDIVVLSFMWMDSISSTGISWLRDWLPLTFPRARILHMSISLGSNINHIAAELEAAACRSLETLNGAMTPGVSFLRDPVEHILINVRDRDILSSTSAWESQASSSKR